MLKKAISSIIAIIMINSCVSETPSKVEEKECIPIKFETKNFDTKQTKSKILIETGHFPLGKENCNDLSILNELKEFITESGYPVKYDSLGSINLSDFNILILISPSIDFSTEEIEKIVSYVKNGGKLVIFAEWGGFGGFNIKPINEILVEANLKISPDIVKETSSKSYIKNNEQIIATNFSEHFIVRNIEKINFYSTSSINIFDGEINSLDETESKIIIKTSESAFSIKEFQLLEKGLIGTAILEKGKIIVSGDSSIITNNDSDNNDINNISEVDNKKLLNNILEW